jgi:hypothetical protein
LLEDVVARTMGYDRFDLLIVTAVSESEEAADLGGDGSSMGAITLSYGLRVRRIGPLQSIRLDGPSSFVFFGKVRAQFSHGIARFLSFSS